MKIADIQLLPGTLPLDPPFDAAWDPVPRTRFDATVVKVVTDEGVVGYGSGDTMAGFEPYAELFLGQDPMAISRHVRALETIAFHAGRYWPLEIALWDVIGKVLGVPVATLFGGAADAIPAYASTGRILPAEQRAEVLAGVREQGFQAAKIRLAAEDFAGGIATMRAVREAVGPEMTLMADLNQAWRMPGDVRPSLDPAAVRRFAAALRELDVFWLEEPLPLDDRPGLRAVRDAGVRVAGGEMVRTFSELLDLAESDVLDVYQPDVALAAGMLRARTLAELVLARNRLFTPHTWSNGLGLLANLHVTAGVGGGPYLEFPYDPPVWTPQRRDFLLSAPLDIDADGLLHVPSAPGLGVEVDEERLGRKP
ncbi:mandelate racemase/muconate lactonizing enzyme family protein [Amycolatopsis dendrobii]|uniref:Mandelate racemase/muconate lactonizing enzyme family protein n=1 Tax=Amycolatopsis dendrobii TaxID=2760662 RepID=A0A7W3ZBC2_9PSEU|nr:mandelate racemase/muconate lactonizing enzyme family protein [Amycolatopsis dendrobii]MBB1154664.1 mandelate racemase/muconate lactonizing enzyme family protein [Amycolatopsis dendrobii]